MANTAITRGGGVVKTNGLEDLDFSYTEGYLKAFTAKGIKYRLLVEQDLRYNDYTNKREFRTGYYNEAQFLEYIATPNRNIKQVERYNLFNYAEKDEAVEVKVLDLRPSVSSEFIYVPVYRKYTFPYEPGTLYVDEDGKLIVQGPSEIVFLSWDTLSNTFYDKNYSLVLEGSDAEEIKERARLLALTAIVISLIKDQIFILFDDYQNIIEQQLNSWKNQKLFTSPSTLADFENYYNATLSFYKSAYYNRLRIEQAEGVEKLYWLASVMSVASLSILNTQIKLDLIKFIVSKVSIRSVFTTINFEQLVVKLIKSVSPTDADLFLTGLLEKVNYGFYEYPIIWHLLTRIDDSLFLGIGGENKKQCVLSLYALWTQSSYNPYQNGVFSETNFSKFTYNRLIASNPDPDNPIFDSLFNDDGLLNFTAAPITLDYQSDSFLGLYFDNFDFYFSDGAERKEFERDLDTFKNSYEAPSGKILAVKNRYKKSKDKGLYGTYDYYQPVTLIQIDQETVINIPVVEGDSAQDPEKINSLVPIFVLKYIDDAGDASDFYTTIGYFVDVVSILAGGYGLASKIRYIRGLSGFSGLVAGTEYGTATVLSLYAATGAELVSLTSGTVSFLFRLSGDAYKNEPWYENLTTVLMWTELFAGAGSALSEKMIRESSKKLIDDFNTNGWPAEFTSDTRGAKARETLEKMEDITARMNRFKTSRIETRPNLLYNYNALSPERKREFFYDFENAPSNELDRLTLYEGDLVKYWEDVEFLKTSRKEVDFLENFRLVNVHPRLKTHIHIGHAGIKSKGGGAWVSGGHNPRLLQPDSNGVVRWRWVSGNPIITNYKGYKYGAVERNMSDLNWLGGKPPSPWKKKGDETSFWPISYSDARINEEMAYALSNKKFDRNEFKRTGDVKVYLGNASDGQKVEILIDMYNNKNIVSIYPTNI